MSLPTPVSSTFRNMVPAITPTWLNGPIGAKYLYSMAVIYDALSDAASYAVRARFPQLAPSDALSWIGQDRQIDRGFQESEVSYVARLLLWLDLWRTAGNAKSMLLAMLGFVTPDEIAVRVVSDSSAWDSYPSGTNVLTAGNPTHLLASPTNWRWDSVADPFQTGIEWWRVWVILYPDSGLWTQGKAWAAFTWGDGTCFGFSGTVDQSSSLSSLAQKWRSAHAWVVYVILAFDSTLFDPSLSFGSSKLPDGNWGHWGKVASSGGFSRVYVPARNQSASYVKGAP